MVKRCCWGTCNSDTRYPERIVDVSFVPFPKSKTNYDDCVRWIKACGRPNDQLNVNKITKDTYVCSKHFIDGYPSTRHPYPIPATGGRVHEARPMPKKRKILEINKTENIHDLQCDTGPCEDNNKETQTDKEFYSALDFLTFTCTNRSLEEENRKLKQDNEDLKKKIKKKEAEKQSKHSKEETLSEEETILNCFLILC